MSPKASEPQAGKAGRPAAEMTRDERRKAALKANMARRKAQARARAEGAGTQDAGGDGGPDREDG
ncbi:hypothetical protein C0V75_18685 [Tabrizicola sp. TH137]|uniref:hypothetical protein n=1 Tax=Tabrizicola sp. TH137 TaxID=2067452 RepID=UPI000C7CC5BE|nr:hypothetical protein [Tabrizicola sp. TH137]PLL10722.1 hypothetical protein C0V75_18685 [Tabrizicola sp. TH137]